MSSSSLRDQLFRAGLVSEDQVKDAETKKRAPKKSGKGKPRGDSRGKSRSGGQAKRRDDRGGEGRGDSRGQGDRKQGERSRNDDRKGGQSSDGGNSRNQGGRGADSKGDGQQKRRRAPTVGRNRFGKPTKTNGNDWQVEVRDMLRRRKQNQEEAADEFNFVIAGEARINVLLVTPDQREALENGKLAIARPLSPRDPFAIMRLREASRLLELEPKRVLYWNGHEEEMTAAIEKQEEERREKRMAKQRVRAGRKIFRLQRQMTLIRRRTIRLARR